jgi:hypothetical protein
LFVRNREREPFAYLGELNYLDHKQFQDRGRIQQRYFSDLKERVPDSLLAELGEGVSVRTKPKQQSPAAATGRRRPVSLDEFKKAFSYALAGC